MIEPGKVMGPKEITAVLKQRYPMLMLDRAMLESENRIVGVKNLCINELFFRDISRTIRSCRGYCNWKRCGSWGNWRCMTV